MWDRRILYISEVYLTLYPLTVVGIYVCIYLYGANFLPLCVVGMYAGDIDLYIYMQN